MSGQPLITFKAGQCELSTASKPYKVVCKPDPGYIFIYSEEEMLNFAWRKRSTPASEPEVDLIVFPDDASFVPYTGKEPAASSDNVESPTNGRIYVLRFQSSSQRYLFWLQSKNQHPDNRENWFSPRDLKLGQVVDRLINGEEVNVRQELRELSSSGPGRRDDDDDTMEDIEGTDHGRNRSNSTTGGAGADATGGDIREEGEESREGGADGGRAAAAGSNDASAIVQNFLNSLQGKDLGGATTAGGRRGQEQSEKIFTTLGDLLPSPVTIPVIENAPTSFIDTLISHLPSTILLLAQEVDDLSGVDPNSETVQAAVQALSLDQKKDILRRVLRSPQMHQGLESTTNAIREGGLPMVGEALKIKVENGGLISGGAVPLGGGDAVEAFVEGVKRTVKEDEAKEGGGSMDTP